MRLTPLAKLLYLLAVAIAAFLLHDWRWLTALGSLQLLLYGLARLPLLGLYRLIRKLTPFVAIIGLSNLVLVPAGEAWNTASHLEWTLRTTLVMGLRVLAVVLASRLVQQTGKPGELVRGMRQLGLPLTSALALDLTLSLLSEAPRQKSGRGDGSGGGRKRQDRLVRELLSGRIEGYQAMLRERLAATEAAVAELDVGLDPEARSDLAVVVGLSFVGLSVKAFKILPGIPFAPGHKGIIVLPLYVLAAALTRGRWGATSVGVTFGVVSFLLGDGRFGPLEIAKHVAPGIVVDLLWPTVRRLFPESHPVVYAVVGLLAALMRLATYVVVGWFAGAPPAFFVLLAPMAIFQLGFGLASGVVTYYLLRALAPTPHPGVPPEQGDS